VKPGNTVNYDTVAENYDVSRRAGRKTVELSAELLGPLADAAVLDVGCGTGNLLIELSPLAGRLVGLDKSAGMLEQAKSKLSGAHFVQGDGAVMPFGDGAFDAVYCIQTLHHIADKTRFVAEVFRTLKKGGRFVIQSCSHEQLTTFWEYHYFPNGLEADRARIPDIADISDLLAQAGFQDITVHECSFEVVFRRSPQRYLDNRYRNGNSMFSLLTADEIEQGCQRIREDLQSGRSDEVVRAYDRKARQSGRVSFISSVKLQAY